MTIRARLAAALCLTGLALPVAAAPDEQLEELVDDIISQAAGDAERALKLYEAADVAKDSVRIQVYMLARGVDYGLAAPSHKGCRDATLRSLHLLDQKAPEGHALWGQKRIELYRAWYRGATEAEQKRTAGKKLLELLLASGARDEKRKKFAEAAATYLQANSIASGLGLPSKSDISQMYLRANHYRSSRQKVEGFQRTLERNSDNVPARIGLLTVLVVDLDAPAEADTHLTDDVGPVWNTYVPLAMEPVNRLKPAACKELGDWYYRMLRNSANSSTAKGIVLGRAAAYYRRFLKTAQGDNLETLPAKMALPVIDKALAQLPPAHLPDGLAPAKPAPASQPAPRPSYPKDAVSFGGHHYKLYHRQVSWGAAKKACKEMGGHLACIGTKKELKFIKGLVGQGRAWVGATNTDKKGRWQWLNGQDLPRGYPLWRRGEPTGQRNEDYATITSTGLQDASSSSRFVTGYICEWPR